MKEFDKGAYKWVKKATATTESGEAVRIDIDKLNRLIQERL